MNILFLTIVKINDICEQGIYTDLMRKFRDEQHQVYIACPIERKYHEKTNLQVSQGVHILNIKTLNIQKTNLIEKALSILFLTGRFLKSVNKYYSDVKFDLVIYSTPPITFNRLISYIKKKDKAYSYLLLKDIFPQNAVDIGIIKKEGIIYQYFRRKEKELYAISDYIGCMSQANVNFIIEHNKQIDINKVEINPNSIEPIPIDITNERKALIRQKYNIPLSATVFVYGGNLGKPQGIDFLIDILYSNINKQDVFFLIVGDGTEYPQLLQWISHNKPQNALLMKHISKTEYNQLLSACDIGLILLDKRFSIPNFPSRLLSYMECKIPVISATDNSTDIPEIMRINNFGIGCLSGDLNEFNKAVDFFINNYDIRINMGINGYNFMLENYRVQHSYQIIMKHFYNV